ncbi:MAG: hypothetical protein MUF00_10590 [Gemmatimonadaceae bacterium]|jgi:hypothetical protein|nr:hypothetical protein [Gemmatimonadaceae bacterium]
MRRFLALVVLVHAAIHLLGVAKAFRLLDLPQLPITIGPLAGVWWGVAAVLLTVTAVGIQRDAPWMWAIGLVALLASQIAIATAWQQASAGTLVNALLFLVVFNAWRRPPADRLDRAYATAVATVRPARIAPELVTEADLAPLPELVRRYLRITGSVGRPRVENFRAVTRGGIRASSTEGYMPYLAEQFNRIGGATRLYLMHARKLGVPVSVYHRYAEEQATMQVRALDLVTIVDARGEAMDKSETVTVFNDRSIFAPASLIDSAITWTVVDDSVVRATVNGAKQRVSAFLKFAPSGELVDFWSDDRGALGPDGKQVTWMRWSTPVSAYKEFAGGRRLASRGEARWHAATGVYTYLTVEIESVESNVTSTGAVATAAAAPVSARTPAVAGA